MSKTRESNLIQDLELFLENSQISVKNMANIYKVMEAQDNLAKYVVALKSISNFFISVKGTIQVLRELQNVIVMGHKVRLVEWQKKSPIGSVRILTDEKDITDLVIPSAEDMTERLHASGLPSFTLRFE